MVHFAASPVLCQFCHGANIIEKWTLEWTTNHPVWNIPRTTVICWQCWLCLQGQYLKEFEEMSWIVRSSLGTVHLVLFYWIWHTLLSPTYCSVSVCSFTKMTFDIICIVSYVAFDVNIGRRRLELVWLHCSFQCKFSDVMLRMICLHSTRVLCAEQQRTTNPTRISHLCGSRYINCRWRNRKRIWCVLSAWPSEHFEPEWWTARFADLSLEA